MHPALYNIAWKALLFIKNAFDTLVRVVGPLFVVLGLTLMSACGYVFFTGILPYHSPYDTLLGALHCAWACWLVFNFVFNYLMCIFTSPGVSPDVIEDESNAAELARLRNEPRPKRGQGFSRYCKACKKPKPPRSHHCGICGACVLKMDHHCPWVNNCVGHNNHRFFTLFLFYLAVSCFWVAAMAWTPYSRYESVGVSWSGVGERGTLSFTFVITLSICIALALMLFWHLYLAASAQTTIEFYFNRWQASQAAMRGESWSSVYNLGWRRNFQDFFGAHTALWWLTWCLPSLRGSSGDGVIWLTASGRTDQYHVRADHYV